MRLLRSFPLMAFALVLLSIVGFCIAQRSVELLLVAGTLAALSWYVTEGPRGRTLPKWVSHVLVVAVSLSVIVDLLHTRDVMGVLGRFSIWLTLIKLYERRTARDHAHLMSLSLLLMLVGCLRPPDLLFAIVLLAYVALGLYVLLLYQLYASYERMSDLRRENRAASTEPLPPLRPTIGRNVALHFRTLTVSAGLGGLLLSIMLFVIFPRGIGQGIFTPHLRAPQMPRVAGYSDEVDLVSGTRITDSQRAVLDVQLLSSSGRPRRLDDPLLLRGAVLGDYQRGRWSMPAPPRPRTVDATGPLPQPIGPIPVRSSELISQRFSFRAGTDTIFGLYLPTGVAVDGVERLLYNPVAQTLRATPDEGLAWNYTLDSHPQPSDSLAEMLSARNHRTERGYLRGARPEDVRRVGELARDLLVEKNLWPPPRDMEARWQWNADAAQALADYLRQGEFTYTLDISDVMQGAEDPVVQFLFRTRRGHCEFFASALAAMCHSIEAVAEGGGIPGIDARLVTGYIAYTYDDEAQQYTVLANNAHAWVEVKTGMHRYTPVDPTPARGLPMNTLADSTFVDRFGWFYQRLENTWINQVMEYDDRRQSRLLDSLDVGWTDRLNAALDRMREWAADVNRLFYLGPAGYIWMALVGIALVLALVAIANVLHRLQLLRRILRIPRWRTPRARQFLLQLGFYADMLAILKRHGLPKPHWQPPLNFAETLQERRPEAAATVRRITELFYQGRYSLRPLASDQVTEARTLVHELPALLKGRR